MTDRVTGRAAALGLVLLIAATAPARAQDAERYRLVELGGSALPVQVEQEWRCREYVTEALLTLGADSLWSLQYTKRERCGDREELETEHEDGRYTVAADTIRFHDDDGDDDRDWDLGRDLDLDELATATRGAGGTLTGRLRDGKTTVLFRR